jgi:hypothetical protein
MTLMGRSVLDTPLSRSMTAEDDAGRLQNKNGGNYPAVLKSVIRR